MPEDNPTPLCTPEQLKDGAFADLVHGFSASAVADMLAEATRACETEVGRRLAPFTGLVESHRMSGVDPDEYSDSASLPLDLAGQLGRSWASSLNSGSDLVRHIWLHQCAPHYPEFWSYSDISISVTRSYGGAQAFVTGGFEGPDVDTGHVWFRLGTWLPIGTYATVRYSGGYTTVPSDLRRACKYMAAAIACRELAPLQANHGHDPDALEALAVSWLAPYSRSD